MRRTTALLLTVALTAGATLPAGPSWAQGTPDDADASAEEGADDKIAATNQEKFKLLTGRAAEAFQDKDYARAADLFKKAYEIKPVPNLLYNIGRVLEKKGDFEEAIAYYEKFVNEPEVELKARQDALQRLKTLREVVALREEGEEVDRDEVPEGDRPDLVEPGEGDEGPELVVEPDYTAAWIFTSLGAVTLLGSGAFAGLAAVEDGSAEDAATLAERRDAADSGETYAAVADGLLAGGVVFSAMALYFWVSPPVDEVPAERADFRLAPSVGPDSASMTFTLEF